jgi:hypothetical protein
LLAKGLASSLLREMTVDDRKIWGIRGESLASLSQLALGTWFRDRNVGMIVDMPNSTVALAMQKLAAIACLPMAPAADD